MLLPLSYRRILTSTRHGLLQLPDFKSGVKIAVHVLYGVTGGTRIHDNQSHNLVFYQLNYGHMEQVMGIEPTSVEWQSTVLAVVLHLRNYVPLGNAQTEEEAGLP